MSSADDLDLATLFPAGTQLVGKYEVVRVLGRGGMGVVVEARHLRMKRDVALKLLLPALRAQRDVVARFEREARAAAQLTDQHVARVLDVDTLPDGSPFMVMELLRGQDLGEHLAEQGKLPAREAVGYLREACAGMVGAHRLGIVHRDLKPSNLFLDAQGGRRVLKILDFGISKVTDDSSQSMTATTSVFGTPLYMSPEQVRSTKNVDARADIWSLGVVLYELLAGVQPFTGPSAPAIIAAIIADKPVPIAELRPDLPPALADVVMRALAKDAAARFPDVQAFSDALQPFGPVGDGPAPAPLLSSVPPGPGAADASTSVPIAAPTRPPGGARPVAAIVVGMGLAFAAGGALLVLAPGRAPHAAATAEPTPPPPVPPPPTVAPVEAALPAPPPATAAPTASVVTARPSALPVKTAAALPEKPAADKPAPDKPVARPTSAPVVTPAPPKPPPSPDDPKYL